MNAHKLAKNKEKKAKVYGDTSWLPENYPLSTRLMVIEEGLSEDTIPRCHCGSIVGFKRSDHKKLKTVCDSCKPLQKMQVDVTGEQLRIWRLDDRLSKEEIASRLGVSPPVVGRLLEEAGIPDVRFNESNAITMAYLRDSEWLETEHVGKRRKLEDIAKEIGSSTATVSRWLQYHGIVANDPNSYDRKAGASKPCLEIAQFIRDLGFEVKLNVRSIISPYEIDIVVPEKNLAIEFNGLYHHVYRPWLATSAQRKGPEYHLRKTEMAKDAGYQLIHIFSDQWEMRRSVVESTLRSKLGVLPKIHGRKCKVVEVSPGVRRAFVDKNHLQGDSPAGITYGLEHDGQLVAVMSFGRSRFNPNADWELIRFASGDFTVVGGFSKLLKHFRKNHPGSIVSYADRSYSDGSVYLKNGFTLISATKPQSWYVDPDFSKRLHRSAFMKKRIAPNDPRPEHEIMLERGYHRIFGCGTLTLKLFEETP